MKQKINLMGWVALFLAFALGVSLAYGIFLFWSISYLYILTETLNISVSVFGHISLIVLWGVGSIYFILKGFNWLMDSFNVRKIKLYKEKSRSK